MTRLADYLAELGWSPRYLASQINGVFGVGSVASTTPYHWLVKGGVPRPPLPARTAAVLSQALGRIITPADLWPQAADTPAHVTALAGADVPWTLAGTVHVVEDWVLGGLMDRREFLAVSGTALTGAATTYLTAPRLDAALSGDRIGDGLMTQIEASLPALRDTDHRHGGQHAMTYVHGQWLTIAALIRDGHHRDTVTARLLAAFAELGDLAGYMAFDSGQHGLAQRYWLTALRAAHHATTRPLAASILGNLSYQAASRGYHTDAVTLAEAAARAARVAPAAVRVSSASRLATAHAAAGDVAGFRAAQHQSEDLFATGETRWPAPDWADFVSSSFLASQGAYALIRLGSTSLDSNRRTGRRLLAQGQDLLRPSLAPYRGEYQRSAVIRAAWLARAYLASGEIEEACSVGRVAMTRLTAVDSPRCRAMLTSLHTALRRGGRRHNQTVREFTHELAHALALDTGRV